MKQQKRLCLPLLSNAISESTHRNYQETNPAGLTLYLVKEKLHIPSPATFFLSFILVVPFFCSLQDYRLPMMAPQQGKEGQRSVHPVGMCGRHEPTVLKHLGWPSIWERKGQELCPTPLLRRSAVPSASQQLLVQAETTKTTK